MSKTLVEGAVELSLAFPFLAIATVLAIFGGASFTVFLLKLNKDDNK